MKKGFTLIEIMIVMAIIGILVAVVLPILEGKHKGRQGSQSGMQESGVSQGSVQGPTPENTYHAPPPPKVECIEGYKFVEGKQMLDTSGHGIFCN